MKKRIILTAFFLCLLVSFLFFIFYYNFFIKSISKEEAGINKYASLLTVQNKTTSKLYIVLKFNFSKNEIQKFKNYRYIEANDYSIQDTVQIGGISDYTNFENFEFSGIVEKPQIIPRDFCLKILDSSKQVLKYWDKINFEKDFKLKNNERTITIINDQNTIIVN